MESGSSSLVPNTVVRPKELGCRKDFSDLLSDGVLQKHASAGPLQQGCVLNAVP